MKRFAQCVNCHQWYVQTYTATVEIYQHDRFYCMATWCVRCIEAAERRSQGLERLPDEPRAMSPPVTQQAEATPWPSTDPFQGLVQAHLQLMDQALYDDETVLVPAVTAFIERCRLSMGTLESPEQGQRLSGHVQYWETFLKTLRS